MLAEVVDAGDYATEAALLGKSQSTISHSVQRLEALLGTRVPRIEGRRAVLTDRGRVHPPTPRQSMMGRRFWKFGNGVH